MAALICEGKAKIHSLENALSRVRTLCLICVFAFLAGFAVTTPAWAADHVSAFTIAGSPFTGYTSQYATGTVTIQRDPGSTGAVPVLVGYSGSGWSGYQCESGQLPSDQGCYVPAGGTSTTIKFFGGCVASASTVTITAKVQYSGDTGLSAAMTVSPFTVTVGASPATYVGGTNQTGTGNVSLNAAPNGALSATLAHPYLTTSPPYYLTIPTSGSASFTIQGGTVTQDTNTSVTANTGCGTGSTGVMVLTGGETNLGVCTDCKTGAGKPINLTNGNVWIRQQDYALPGLGGGLEVTRTWNSQWRSVTYIELNGAFGDSWRSTYEERLGFLTGGDKKYWREDGSAWIFRWDSINQGYVLISPPDTRASLSYDSSTTKYTLTFLDGSKRIFNSGGYLINLIDRNGNQTTITLTGSNRPSQATDAAGRWVKFNYDAYARISTLQDATGTVATYSWNGYGLTRVTYADGSFINYTYNASNLILSVTDTSGKVLESHTYDGFNRGLTSQRANLVDKVTVSYTSTSSTRLTDSLSNVTDYGFQPRDGRQFITSITGPGCASCGGRGNSSFTYDAGGNQTSSTDALGRTTTYTYDGNSNVLTRSIVVNGQALTWSYTYNGFGQVLTATDPLGHATTNVYDAKGNLTSTTSPSPDGTQAGSVTSFAYDVKGELTSVTDPLSNATSIYYTAAGLIDHITDVQSNTTTFGYDARANRTSVTDALSHQTTFTYNNMSRLTRVTNPDATHTDFAYDTRGRRTSVTDASSKVTSYAYDDADRLVTVTDAQTPTHGVTQYAYDTENNLTSLTDALSRVTSFTYDSLGRVTQTTFPSTLTETYTYDAVGNLLSKTDRKGQAIGYSYDQLDRLTHKGYPDSTGVDYTFDAASRLTEVADPTGTYQFSLDNVGRLTGTTTNYAFLTARTFTNAYAYDAASNRTSFTDPESGATSYVYDTLNRLSSLTNFSSQQFGFTYDALGRRTQTTRPNGINTSYSYDNLSRLLSVLHTLNSTTIDGATYTVDAVGNRTVKANQLNSVTENYGYDAIYQLLQVTQGANTTESYSYDRVGNRLSSFGVSPYSYNNSNQLASTPSATYTYDNNGNTLTKTVGTDVTTYAWDFENRLVSVTLPGSGGTVSFKYDPFGRRIQKSSASGTTNYAYDGADMAEEVDASGSALARYTMGPGIDEPLTMLRGGVSSYYQADGLGSVTSLTDGSGSLAASYTYDSFGKLVTSSGTPVNPFRYTARESDSETGLYYYRARYYDPSVGRFLSEDPLGFGGEDVNFYRYVDNDPTDWFDPFGLMKKKSHKKPKPPIDPCPKEKRCFFNWLDGPLGGAAQDLNTTKALMFTMAAKEGGWTQPALNHNMPLNNPFGVNRIKNGQAVGNIAYSSLSAAINSWESNFGDRVSGDTDPGGFVHDLQHPDPPGKPYNSVNPNYEDEFEQVYNAVQRFMKLCGIKP
jgi:RHS repeat-associated protein